MRVIYLNLFTLHTTKVHLLKKKKKYCNILKKKKTLPKCVFLFIYLKNRWNYINGRLCNRLFVKFKTRVFSI